MKEVSSRDAHIEELQKKLAGIQDEHAELKAELNTHLALVASLADHVSVLEEDCRSLSKPCSTEDKEVSFFLSFLLTRHPFETFHVVKTILVFQ